MVKKPVISIMMGSDSDLPHLQDGIQFLDDFGVGYEVKVLSAHRTPEQTAKYVKSAKGRGIKVIIAAAGGAAHLPGVVSAMTTLPVVGVPIMTSAFKGVDSLLSILQMPKGIPVATMAIGKAGGRNGVLYALRIVALSNKKVRVKLDKYIKDMAKEVMAKNKKLCK